jgi:hypothetical protein
MTMMMMKRLNESVAAVMSSAVDYIHSSSGSNFGVLCIVRCSIEYCVGMRRMSDE